MKKLFCIFLFISFFQSMEIINNIAKRRRNPKLNYNENFKYNKRLEKIDELINFQKREKSKYLKSKNYYDEELRKKNEISYLKSKTNFNPKKNLYVKNKKKNLKITREKRNLKVIPNKKNFKREKRNRNFKRKKRNLLNAHQILKIHHNTKKYVKKGFNAAKNYINNAEVDVTKVVFDAGILASLWGVSNYAKHKVIHRSKYKQLIRRLGVVQINRENLKEDNKILGMALEKLQNSKETVDSFKEGVGAQLEDTLMKIVENK